MIDPTIPLNSIIAVLVDDHGRTLDAIRMADAMAVAGSLTAPIVIDKGIYEGVRFVETPIIIDEAPPNTSARNARRLARKAKRRLFKG